MRALIVGSGGREHALAWALVRSPSVDELHAAPGNPGIAQVGTCHPVRADDAEGLLALARSVDADLVAIGPEAPLVAGVADHLRHAGVAVFGPSAAAARIEGSKSFAKDVLAAANVPTAAALAVARAPCVVKADGLAAGKGVFVCRTEAELDDGLRAAAALGGDVLVEELLEGPELSVLAICDGATALALPAARDYKRARDGDEGPNTGGMGAVSPVSGFERTAVAQLVETIHRPVLRELSARGAPFVGVLYAGLMLTSDGPRVLEFNCRFGDPETQAIVPRLEGDLFEALIAAAAGDLGGVELGEAAEAAVSVALVARDYPVAGDSGGVIEGIADAEALGAHVFHAGTARHGDALITNGGRILNVTALGPTSAAARTAAYAAAERISFPGVRYRTDIGADA